MVPCSTSRGSSSERLSRPKVNTSEAAAHTDLGKSTLDRFRLLCGGPTFSRVCSREGNSDAT